MNENYGDIRSRYLEISKILEDVYRAFADDKIFSSDKLVKFTDGPEKGQYGWELSACPEIEKIVETSRERLMATLKMVGGRGKMVEQDLADRCRRWVEEYCGVNQNKPMESTSQRYNQHNQTIQQPYQSNTNNRQKISILVARLLYQMNKLKKGVKNLQKEYLSSKIKEVEWKRLLERLHIYYFD